MNVTFEKKTEVRGTKKVEGRFTNLPFYPYCEKHVESLMTHMRDNHPITE
jgi:hypothetical protein